MWWMFARWTFLLHVCREDKVGFKLENLVGFLAFVQSVVSKSGESLLSWCRIFFLSFSLMLRFLSGAGLKLHVVSETRPVSRCGG